MISQIEELRPKKSRESLAFSTLVERLGWASSLRIGPQRRISFRGARYAAKWR
jgi:hypothetical protein